MNGVGLPTVGRPLGHRRRATTAIYAHLDDDALQDTAAQAVNVIARATGFTVEAPSLTGGDEADDQDKEWFKTGMTRRSGLHYRSRLSASRTA